MNTRGKMFCTASCEPVRMAITAVTPPTATAMIMATRTRTSSPPTPPLTDGPEEA